MKHLQSYKIFESKNYKIIPDDLYRSALKELKKEDQFDNIDDLFGFYDYWLSVSNLPSYDPVKVKDYLDWYYSSPPSSDEEWFPMWTSDGDTVEFIMNELSRIYADSSFKPGPKNCSKCNQIFTQTNRHNTFCSSTCEKEYDKAMSNYR